VAASETLVRMSPSQLYRLLDPDALSHIGGRRLERVPSGTDMAKLLT